MAATWDEGQRTLYVYCMEVCAWKLPIAGGCLSVWTESGLFVFLQYERLGLDGL